MNSEFSQLMIQNLIEENKKLKKQLIQKNNTDSKILNEKISIIRFLFTTFENCKNFNYPYHSIVLFGSFIENLLFKQSINNDHLQFYFSLNQIIALPHQDFEIYGSAIKKLFNILNNTDYFSSRTTLHQNNNTKIWLYNVNKNGVKFNISFYEVKPERDIFFNLQNIEFDSLYGLKIYKITDNDIQNNISDRNISLLNILKSHHINTTITISQNVYQKDLINLIKNQKTFEKNGYKIKNGLKVITLSEQCGICYNKNVKGYLLDCRHSFCTQCTIEHLKPRGDELIKKCPFCRGEFNIIFE